jgi:ketosteroid isomerase-like protein
MASNRERLEEVYDRFWKHRDVNAGRELFADDIEWIGVEDVGLGGNRRGQRGVGRFFEEWLDAWADYDNDVEFIELTPDLILANTHFRGRAKGSGIELDTHLGQVWEFEDGKAVRQTMFRTYEEAREFADRLVRADAG